MVKQFPSNYLKMELKTKELTLPCSITDRLLSVSRRVTSLAFFKHNLDEEGSTSQDVGSKKYKPHVAFPIFLIVLLPSWRIRFAWQFSMYWIIIFNINHLKDFYVCMLTLVFKKRSKNGSTVNWTVGSSLQPLHSTSLANVKLSLSTKISL